MTVTLMWAQSRNGIIGEGGGLPWRLPEDLAHFRALTAGGAVIMGRRTWESLPERFRPLPGRTNIVLSRSPGWNPVGASVAPSLDEAFATAVGRELFVIGGRAVFDQALNRADVLEVTEINQDFAGDTTAPTIPPGWDAIGVDPATGWRRSETGLDYRFLRYTRARAAG